MTGVIVLDKPVDFTSFDAVAVLRGISKEKKIGHTGTLDPMATGVLPLLLGKGTKALSVLQDTEKSYEATFRLGVSTDTQDITGAVIKNDEKPVTKEELEAVLPDFTGEIAQIPPMYSAVSVGGKRLYQLAREGKEVEREARKINIVSLELLSYDEEKREGSISVSCSKGTYIRTLIDDMGKALGCVGAVMTALRRTKACGFTLEDAVSLEELRKPGADISSYLRPIDRLFDDLITVTVSEAQEKRFLNGGELALERLKLPRIRLMGGESIRVYGPSGFLGLGSADMEKAELKILKLMADKN